MRRMLLIFLVLIVSGSLIYAGEPKTKRSERELFFMMNGFGDFGIIGAHAATVSAPAVGTNRLYGAGGRLYVSDELALRAAVAGDYERTSTKTTAGDNTTTETAIGIEPALEWHCPAVGPISPYWGVLAQFGWVKGENTPPGGTASSASGTYFGAGFMLGAQWWAFDGVAFNAEYNLRFRSTSSKTESGGVSTDGPTVTEIEIDTWAVGVNINVGQ